MDNCYQTVFLEGLCQRENWGFTSLPKLDQLSQINIQVTLSLSRGIIAIYQMG
ncbi:unnamed protein product (macronuclear) [Paramecium tetraurelia]|uniref:Uncharacterized protein n=1 Tax=Paramecium tetraurelia TaxID=5888 RepID=A0BYW5_PARTE|nr:uncharacterized protein GSPATT00033585001 [Paramecium tetraurelia]CAK63732.1 unnamed protein product [Paramecium tetraurelia]|eukprot:XP_001431130.1 hypothetical protein (macronuclear) [Paramecium tetraurelia strain d4-2]